MAAERDLELLDDYLSNRMSGAEKEAFEKQLDADIELKNEYQTQQQLIQGIKNARAVELKTMLKNIPVSPSMVPGEATLLTKVAASLVVAGLIGTGIYFYINRENKPEQSEPVAQAEPELSEKAEAETTTETEPALSENKHETPSVKTTDKLTVKEERKPSRKVARAAKKASKDSANLTSNQSVIAEKRKLEVFDPTRESESVVKGKNKETSSETATLNENASSIQVETDNTNKKYTFHYQWKNGKLLLYGSFEKNLYEILEFFGTDDKRTAFLYYKDNYYLLNEDNEKVKELVPITDSNLLKKLKEHREN